jgi:hypothetical protein
MTTIDRTVAYFCDYCNKRYITDKELITISGQWDGLSDRNYKFHFCNYECLKKEIEKYKDDDNDYIYILENYIRRKVEK